MKTYKDQIGRILALKKTPQRIISLVPSLTELLVDLGLESAIVGLTKFCVHPSHLKKTKTIIGGTKNINLKKIKALNPDIILCNKEENTKEIVALCEHIAPTHISDIFTIDDTLELINLYGELFSREAQAKKIVQEIRFKLVDFQQFIENKKLKKVAYFIWKKPWMVAGKKTFIHHMLQLNKFDNIYKNIERYPEIHIDNIELKRDADFIFLSSEPYPFKKKDISEMENLSNARVILVNGEMFSWYGSRLLKAFDYFKALHQKTV
jgi:ABC-type Fe3+-hydroxamate transport system substrate-binding protein